MDYKTRLTKCENGKQKCSLCDRTIPKEVERVSFYYSGAYGRSSYHRICGYCISQLYNVLDKKPIRDWKLKLVIEEL